MHEYTSDCTFAEIFSRVNLGNMVFYEKSFLHLWVDPDIYLMYSEWKQLPSKEEYLEGVRQSEIFLLKYQVKYWIMDSTRLAAMPIDQQRESLNHVAQVMVNSSLKKLARIIPKDNNVITLFEDTLLHAKIEANSPLEVDRFDTFKAAADWIGNIHC